MKIVHLCLCSPFTDNWSYHDNLLPKYHKQLGYDVAIIASEWMFDCNGKIVLDTKSEYINENGIKVTRLKCKGNKSQTNKLKRFEGLYDSLEKNTPEILFIHSLQFLDVDIVIQYIKKHPSIIVYADNHADFSNSALSWMSKNILHKIIWHKRVHMIEPYIKRFYGVLPARVDFLREMYKLPAERINLLVMGADDDKVNEAIESNARKMIREKYNIQDEDFLVITGGKIDSAKRQTIELMKAIKAIDKDYIKLILFGSVEDDIKEDFMTLVDNKKIQYIGWVNGDETYNYFSAADLVVFPGRHSVFWEQVVGLGIPCIFKYWDGTTHIDVGGNCKFLYKDSADEMKELISKLVNNTDDYESMKALAKDKGMKVFSYKEIARTSIEEA